MSNVQHNAASRQCMSGEEDDYNSCQNQVASDLLWQSYDKGGMDEIMSRGSIALGSILLATGFSNVCTDQPHWTEVGGHVIAADDTTTCSVLLLPVRK